MGKLNEGVAAVWRLFGAAELRASPENPSTDLGIPANWLEVGFGNAGSLSGVTITERNATQLMAVFAAVRIIAESVASLPLMVYERLAGGGKRVADEHPLFPILHDQPHADFTSFVFRETLQGHLGLWGNGYAMINVDGMNKPIGMMPLLPDRTAPVVLPDKTVIYRSRLAAGGHFDLPASRVLHVPALSFDGIKGWSPITIARQTLGLSMATEQFGARFFGSGTQPSGVLEVPQKLDDLAMARLAKHWRETYSTISNSHKVAILEQGASFKAISIPPEDAQFLETRKFQIAEVARLYRVPLHMLADLDRATFANSREQAAGFLKFTLRPWLVRWEQELNRKLFAPHDGRRFFCEFNVDALLRGDADGRAKYFRSMWQIGAMSINEIRAIENMNPVDGGDDRFVPLNMIPHDDLGKDDDDDEKGDGDARTLDGFEGVLRDSIKRSIARGRDVDELIAPVLVSFAIALGAPDPDDLVERLMPEILSTAPALEAREILEFVANQIGD